jgi:hypothetical protein
MLQNHQMAHTLFPWILQGFLCCNLFGAEFAWLWHIAKELTSVPQKNEAGATSHLFLSDSVVPWGLNLASERAQQCCRWLEPFPCILLEFFAAIHLVQNFTSLSR